MELQQESSTTVSNGSGGEFISHSYQTAVPLTYLFLIGEQKTKLSEAFLHLGFEALVDGSLLFYILKGL